MMDKIIFVIIILLVFLSGSPAGAGLTVLEGEHVVVYDIVNPRGVAYIPDYSNESFEQKVISQDEFSKRVQVTSKMLPSYRDPENGRFAKTTDKNIKLVHPKEYIIIAKKK